MLTEAQRIDAEKYSEGLDKLADAVERLNDLGRKFDMPPLTMRCMTNGYMPGWFVASSKINNLLQSHYLEAMQLQMTPERRAA